MTLELIKTLGIDDLVDLPVTEYAEKGMAIYRKLQDSLAVMAGSDDSESLTKMKIGTVLTIAVLKKIATDKVMPKAFTKEDWAQIAESVKDVAIYMDDRDYSLFVFGLYTDYVRGSAGYFQGIAPQEKIDAINALADELQEKANLLKAEIISEVAYTEDCLWICLEAMIKLLSCMTYLTGNQNVAEFAQAAAMYAFEYGRFVLYRKEQALVTEYLENQRQLDAKLQAKFEAYKAELEAESNQFMALVDNAFDPQFRASLHASAELARAAGVKEEEILKTVEDVDEFFMD